MCGDGPLGLSPKAKKIETPDPVIPAPPAPSRKQDTGAVVAIGDTEDELDMQRKKSYAKPIKGGAQFGLGSDLSI